MSVTATDVGRAAERVAERAAGPDTAAAEWAARAAAARADGCYNPGSTVAVISCGRNLTSSTLAEILNLGSPSNPNPTPNSIQTRI